MDADRDGQLGCLGPVLIVISMQCYAIAPLGSVSVQQSFKGTPSVAVASLSGPLGNTGPSMSVDTVIVSAKHQEYEVPSGNVTQTQICQNEVVES